MGSAWAEILSTELGTVPSFHPFFLKIYYFLLLFVCICFVCRYPCVLGACGGQERVLDPLEQELQTVFSYRMGAGNWSWVFGRAADAFNRWAISPDPSCVLDHLM